MTTTTKRHIADTAQMLALNVAKFFTGRVAAQSVRTIPRWTAANGKQCAIRLTSGAGVLVEIITMSRDYTGPVFALKPMVKTIEEAAEFIVAQEAAWMSINNAA